MPGIIDSHTSLHGSEEMNDKERSLSQNPWHAMTPKTLPVDSSWPIVNRGQAILLIMSHRSSPKSHPDGESGGYGKVESSERSRNSCRTGLSPGLLKSNRKN